MALPHDHQPPTDTATTSSHIHPARCHWFSALADALDIRSAPRLALLFLGVRGRRTVTSWIRAAGLSAQYRHSYTAVAATGTNAEFVAARLTHQVLKPIVAGMDRIVVARASAARPDFRLGGQYR